MEDHAKALVTVVEKGAVGETYNVGGRNERTNLEIVETICDVLDELRPLADCGTLVVESGTWRISHSASNSSQFTKNETKSYKNLFTCVADRPGHDQRYAIDATKLETELGWKAQENFDTGIRRTIQWYLDNEWWWGPIREGKYSGERLRGSK